jgi:hypothetical protein
MNTRPSRPSYRVIATKNGPLDWQWEILRDNRPLSIRLREGPFRSEEAAIAAGTAALREFLKLLEQAENS